MQNKHKNCKKKWIWIQLTFFKQGGLPSTARLSSHSRDSFVPRNIFLAREVNPFKSEKWELPKKGEVLFWRHEWDWVWGFETTLFVTQSRRKDDRESTVSNNDISKTRVSLAGYFHASNSDKKRHIANQSLLLLVPKASSFSVSKRCINRTFVSIQTF